MNVDFKLLSGFKDEILDAEDIEQLNAIKSKYVGKKGLISLINKSLRNLSAGERTDVGKEIQKIRKHFEEEYLLKERQFKEDEQRKKLLNEVLDITLPGFPFTAGSQHPITAIYNKVINIFAAIGFEIVAGPEAELDYYNFEALNMPKNHPARDMQDTFYISEDVLLRTHTSPVQIRVMKKTKPPVRIIAPGKVYRCDSDVTHTPMFHQVEGLVVDKNITFSDLKSTLTMFLKRLFDKSIDVRFRPSFFPFTEPSAEVDIRCVMCDGSGCRVCSGTGWLEILGCGMVDPAVFEAVEYDAEKISGYAFGMGIERITMLLYQIDDIRLFFENNLRFLGQF